MRIALAATGLGFGALLFILGAPWVLARRVEFTVPDDFRGLIEVYHVPSGERFRGTVIVPADGRIGVSAALRNSELRKIEARWSSGEALEIKSIGEQTAEGVYFWILSYPSRPVNYFFVGTLEDLKIFWEKHYQQLYG